MASALAVAAAYSSKISAMCSKQVITPAAFSASAWHLPRASCSGRRARSGTGCFSYVDLSRHTIIHTSPCAH